MNSGFKQRLVGAIVLLSIALILWPIVFDDPFGPVMDQRSQIPPAPGFEKYTVPQPDRVLGLDPIATVSSELPEPISTKEPVSASVPAAVTELPPQPQQPHLDDRNLPVGWVLQVASFTSKQNADDLKSALQSKGHKAFTRSINTKDGLSTRVYIGPRLAKNAFDKDKAKIDKSFKVNSMVIRFEQ